MKFWTMRSFGFGFVLLVISVLVGCSGRGDVLTLDRIGYEDAPNSMDLQLNNSYTHQSSTQSWAEGFDKRFRQFVDDHPDWKFNLTIVPDSETTQEQSRLLEAARAGRAPDCANVDSFVVGQFIDQGVLQPIDQYLDQDEINGLFPFVRDIVIGKDGRMYAYWWATDVRVLYRRTDLVPDAPKTWDELLQAAQSAKSQDSSVDGFLFNGGRWEGTVFDNLAHFWSQGGELVDSDGNPVFNEGNNRTYMLNTLNFLKEAVDSGAAPERVSTIKNYDDFQSAAQARQVAMFQGGDFQYPALKDSLSPEDFDKWEVSLLPTRSANDTPATGTGGWTMGAFTNDPDKAQMCMTFTKEVFVGDGNEITGQLPTNPKYFDSLDAFQAPIYSTFREALEYGRARPGTSTYPDISNELQTAIGTVLTGEATPEEALDKAEADLK